MGRELFQVIRERNFGMLSSAEKNLVKLMNDLKVLKPEYPTNPYDLSRWNSQKEVYAALMEAVQTMNSKTIKPRGVLYAAPINGKIVVGFALLNSNYFEWSKENKDVLREIARGRAMTWFPYSLDDVKIPESIMMELYVFIKRANAYFKQEKLVDWAREFAFGEEQTEETITNIKTMEFVNIPTQELFDALNRHFLDILGVNPNIRFQEDAGC